ncbi:MAG: hypothetical protein KDA90_02445 [Planctomycetaceae bacterium]|nr:hypothetical protein [Planctomycetaceae bacterium]
MSSYQSYRQSNAREWTRIKMLIELYGELERTLQRGIESDPAETSALAKHQLRAMKLFVAVLEGINPEHDEVAANIHRLMVFAMGQLGENTPAAWKSAHGIVSELLSAFRGIEQEATDLERSGAIPPLPQQTQYQLSVG